MDLIKDFVQNNMERSKDIEKTIKIFREDFLIDYPINKIENLTLEEYLAAKDGYGNPKSFCKRIYKDSNCIAHLGNTRLDMFGIYLNNGTELTLSTTFKNKFGNDTDRAFKEIKNEVLRVLRFAESEDFDKVASSPLNSAFVNKLVMIYFPEKVIPVATDSQITKYFFALGIDVDKSMRPIEKIRILKEIKDSIPEMDNWSNYNFMSFCNYLVNSKKTFNHTMFNKNIYEEEFKKIENDINSINVEGYEKEILTKARVNQSTFRERLVNKYQECCLCHMNKTDLLIASHIKPWKDSDSREKVDINNGLLLCPNHDKLFDQGYISFDDDGLILVSSELSNIDRLLLNVKGIEKIDMSDSMKEYMKYHRKNVFRG